MSYIMVDVVTDGPIPGDYSMVSFAAVVVEPTLSKTFIGKIKPISKKYSEDELKKNDYIRTETFEFDEPEEVLMNFQEWLLENSKGDPVFISDNNGFDWMFINWYFYYFVGSNPFGNSSYNFGSLYKGLVKDTSKGIKHLRKTEYNNNPIDNVVGNAETLLMLKEKFNLNIDLD